MGIQHCSTEELEDAIVIEYSEEIVKRVKLLADIKERAKKKRKKEKEVLLSVQD